MSKAWLFFIGVVLVIVVLYRRQLARKRAAEAVELQDVTGMGSASSASASEILTGGTSGGMRDSIAQKFGFSGTTKRAEASPITREEFEALPKAKIVNMGTGQEVGWGPRAPVRPQVPRDEVAAMLPIVNSSPTATRGNYRTGL